jgi:hypothetical protein
MLKNRIVLLPVDCLAGGSRDLRDFMPFDSMRATVRPALSTLWMAEASASSRFAAWRSN